MTRRPAYLAAAALAPILTAVLWPRIDAGVQGPTVEVREQTLSVTVPFFGSIDSIQGETLVSRLRGKPAVLVALAEDGALVEKGDLIARFDASGIEAELARLVQERSTREAAVAAAAQLRAWEEESANASVESGEYEIAKARSEVERHRTFLSELRRLAAEHPVLAGDLEIAGRKLAELEDGELRAEGELQAKKREAAFRIARAMIDSDKARADLAAVEAQIDRQREALLQTELHAPFDGIVVLAEAFRDGTLRKPRLGDAVLENQPVAYLPDLSRLLVRTEVPEGSLHLLELGMPATVSVDAYPELSLPARLSRIGAMATAVGTEGGAGKRFRIELALAEAAPMLRPGMTARGDILVETLSAGPTVPLAAVHSLEGRTLVYVAAGGERARREVVQLGRRNEQWAQLLAGPPAGTRLLLAPPAE